jgi:hypothetical protein
VNQIIHPCHMSSWHGFGLTNLFFKVILFALLAMNIWVVVLLQRVLRQPQFKLKSK